MRSTARLSDHPIHPILVAFPIGLFVTGFIFDLAGVAVGQPRLWAAGWYCIIGGLIGGVAAAIPGVIDLLTAVPPASSARKRGWTHGLLNTCVIALFIAMAAYRGDAGTQPNALALLVQACGLLMLGFSGWLGGTLVYRNQIGVDHRYAGAGRYKNRKIESWDRPACNQAELAEGQMMLIEAAGERVVVGRCPQGIAAFSDHCTHRGGSLADGALVGCTVQCPWHGSQFDIHTGRVVAGPAERQIDTNDVDVRAAEVYVVPRKNDDATKAA